MYEKGECWKLTKRGFKAILMKVDDQRLAVISECMPPAGSL